MTVLKRRDRIVVFRLTKDEYQRLQKACSSTGARNLSDYTRAQLLDSANGDERSDLVEVKLTLVEEQLSELQKTVRQISRTLKQLANTSPED